MENVDYARHVALVHYWLSGLVYDRYSKRVFSSPEESNCLPKLASMHWNLSYLGLKAVEMA